MRYVLHLSYFGKNYSGWQRQDNALSVQEEVENTLSTLLKNKTELTGCGRTDSGVHAHNFYAHFDTESPLPKELLYHANSVLCSDITLHGIISVPHDWHARFSAVKRSYRYYISLVKNPFMRDFSWQTPYSLDINSMKLAADTLKDYNDFTSFARLHGGQKTNFCTIKNVGFTQKNNTLIFEISEDRFLRNMVRAIVGTLVDVGRGYLSTSEFISIIEDKDRSSAGASAPAQGLFLTSVEYNPTLGKEHYKNVEDFPYL